MKKNTWNEVYSKNFSGMWYPSEGVVKFTARYLKRKIGIKKYDIKKDVRRILDVGCGNGRHVVFFAEHGYDVYGIDISSKAIEIANTWISMNELNANVKVGNIEKLRFDDEYFDVVILHEVLDHVTFSNAKKSMNEIKRVLTANGYIYITLRSTEDSEFGVGEEVEHNTFILQNGYEKGVIQHYFDLEEIKELLEGFSIFDIELHEEKFPSIFTVYKAFSQSSRKCKKYIDISKHFDMNLKYSRWHIAAEKT